MASGAGIEARTTRGANARVVARRSPGQCRVRKRRAARTPAAGSVPPSPRTVSDVIGKVVSVLTPDLLSARYAADLPDDAHPTTGHCSVAAEAVYFMLGGTAAGLIAIVARDHDGTTHWWLVHKASGTIIDPTRSQYDSIGDRPPYERGIPGMPCGFQGQRRNPNSRFGFGRDPGKRAAEVIRRVEERYP